MNLSVFISLGFLVAYAYATSGSSSQVEQESDSSEEYSNTLLQKQKAAFNLMDADGNGAVDVKELEAIVTPFGSLTDEEALTIIKEINSNENEAIEFSQPLFVALLDQLISKGFEELPGYLEAFIKVDLDHDRLISESELKKAVIDIYDGAKTDEEIDQIIQETLNEVDKDGNGLDFTEFVYAVRDGPLQEVDDYSYESAESTELAEGI